MTVGELIKRLSEVDQNLIVLSELDIDLYELTESDVTVRGIQHDPGAVVDYYYDNSTSPQSWALVIR